MSKSLVLKLILFFAILSLSALPSVAQEGNFQTILLSGSGRPINATVAICSNGLATTGATVLNNIATLTMASNPTTAGFLTTHILTVSGFTGADTYFNGTYTVLAVNATTISYSLVHANASASTNGLALQTGDAITPCAPLATIFTDYTGVTTTANPFSSGNLGNVSVWAATGVYNMQSYGQQVVTTITGFSIGATGPTVDMDTIAQGGIFVKTTANSSPYPIVYNGNFEAAPTLPVPGWEANPNATLSYETASPFEGLQTLKMVSNSNPAGTQVSTEYIFDVRPGDVFFVQGVAKSDGIVTAEIHLSFLAANSAIPLGEIIASTNSVVYAPISASGTAPAGTVYAGIRLTSTPGGTVGTTWFDAINIYRVSYPNSFTPATAGGADIGSTLLPYGSIWIGTNPTNNVRERAPSITGNRIQDHPDITGNIVVAGAAVDLTTQSAAITATTIFTPITSGLFRISVYMKVTTPATTGAGTSTMGPVTLTYTDATDSVAQSNVVPLTGAGGTFTNAGNTTNTTGATSTGSLIIWAKTGVPIQYAIGYASNTAAQMQYEVHLKLEPL